MTNKALPELELTGLELMVCKFPPTAEIPENVLQSSFYSLTKTKEELSLVCPASIEVNCPHTERDWNCFRVKGTLDFSLTGILFKISKPLAEEKISLFAISTYNTDYILVKKEKCKKALKALKNAGFLIT